MKKLSTESYQLARKFIKKEARPIDRALFEYGFEEGRADAVWEALQHFTKEDGGFGHALEPDCRLPGSSVLGTITAFPYLIQTGAAAKHPLVNNGVQYLLDTYDRDLQGWPMLPAEANDHPRAMWWNYVAPQTKPLAPENWANPSAAVVGILHHYKELVPSGFLKEVTDKAVPVLRAKAKTLAGHDYLAFIEFAKALTDESMKSFAWAILKQQACAAIETDPAKWMGYGVRPLWAVANPSSPLMEELEGAVNAHLDFDIDQQQADGSWHPFWSWGRFDEEWEIAKAEWQGQLTVKVLSSLQAFGRIA